MKFMYIISFFLFLNFMLILLPRLMPNIVTGGQLVFWIIWVNAMFIFTLVLPHQASYIFPFKSGVKIFKMFKKINSDKADKDDEKMQEKKTAQKNKTQEKTQTQEKINNTNDDLNKRIEDRKKLNQ